MNTKKLFSVFLSIVMVLCMMPSLAFAAEDTGGGYTERRGIQ